MEKAFFRFPLLFSCLLLSSLYAAAQELKDSIRSDFKKNQIGFYTGVGFSGIREHYYNPTGYHVEKMIGSPNFSLIYQKNILPHFAIRTGIGYVRKGDNYRFYTGFGPQMTRVKVTIHYIEVPVLITLQGRRKFAPYLNAGVSYGIALGKSHLQTWDPVTNEDDFRNYTGKDIYNRLDNALVGSAGFKIRKNNTDFLIEIQYSYSITDVFYYRSNNNVISCHLGFLFGK